MRKIFFTLFLLSLVSFIQASVYMGGEITWEQVKQSGNYRIILKLYAECGATDHKFRIFENLDLINYPKKGDTTTFVLHRRKMSDGSPLCNIAGPRITCAGALQALDGSMSEYIYTTDSLNPLGVKLSGVPPTEGWIFTYRSPNVSNNVWKRDSSSNIQKSDQISWCLRAILYPYKDKNGKYKDAYPCYDNSPTFAEKPSTIICIGNPYTYNPNGFDNELDSLVYSWAPALDRKLNQLSLYKAGYSYNSPLPGPSHHPLNVPATINPQTGEISFTSHTKGAFITVSRVRAYKNKQLVAEIFREMEIVLLDCGANASTLPHILPPFKDKNGNYTSFTDTIYAGETVDFSIIADGTSEYMTFTATGADIYNSIPSLFPNSCMTPSCATLSNPPPYKSYSPLRSDFHWQTSCNHLAHSLVIDPSNPHLIYNQPVISNVHTFVISIQDSACPVPAKTIKTISIVILNPPKLPAPDLNCLTVLNNGDVQIDWSDVQDTLNSLYCYYLYYSDNKTGAYDSVKVNDNTFTQINAGANNKIVYYYLRTFSGCNGVFRSETSDTLNTMFLTLTKTDNKALLKWNTVQNPPKPSTIYQVYRKINNGFWTYVNSSDTTLYTDEINVCNAVVSYRIQLQINTAGCNIISNTVTDVFTDKTPPEVIIIDSISIDNNLKQTIISWKPDVSPDTDYYIIYKQRGNNMYPIDTVYGINNTFYRDSLSNPYLASESYYVIAFDSCNNGGIATALFNTIYLQAFLNICDATVTLQWNAYKNVPGLSGYYIYYKEKNQSSYSLLGTVDNKTLQFIHTNIKSGEEYSYYIKTFNNTGTTYSSSNIVIIQSVASRRPQFAYLRYASVEEADGKEYVKLRCISDDNAYISGYGILRADSSGTSFGQVTKINANGIADIFYNDYSAIPSANSYTYKVEVYDSCGNVAVTSNTARTIFLKGQIDDNLSNKLNWIPYRIWDADVAEYNLYRKTSNMFFYEFIDDFSPMVLDYTDVISGTLMDEGKFIYKIEAISNPGSNYPFIDTARSNRLVILHTPVYYVPNAFNPEGENKILVPKGIFVNPDDYYFAVFNRLGAMVFETNEPEKGWNGYINGKLAASGIYVYILRYKDFEGNKEMKKGSVLLLK